MISYVRKDILLKKKNNLKKEVLPKNNVFFITKMESFIYLDIFDDIISEIIIKYIYKTALLRDITHIIQCYNGIFFSRKFNSKLRDRISRMTKL